MLEIIKAGGWMMAPILLLSAVAMAIVVERFWSLRRKQILPEDLGLQVMQWAQSGRLDDRHIDALAEDSLLGRVLAAALYHRNDSREVMKEAVEDTGRHVVYRMERYLNTLGTIAAISPLLGLLGTVIGMIQVFSAILTHGVGNANLLAGGISQALITTAAGLTVAIPALFFHRYFIGRVNEYVLFMEEQAMQLIDHLSKRA